MKLKGIMPIALCAATLVGCKHATPDPEIDYTVDRFADIEVLRYTVPDFDSLSIDQKRMVYYLTEAALTGRDIIWDQNCAANLPIRDLIEAVYTNYDGDREDADFKAFETYVKQVEFANGIHHHYSMDKFKPAFSRQWLDATGRQTRPGA